MENFPLRGVTLIEEDSHTSATALTLATLNRLQNVSYQVLTVALLGEERELERLFTSNGLMNVRIISVDIPQFDQLIEQISSQLNHQQTDKQLIYINCGDALLRFVRVDKAIRYLHLLSKICPVITRIFHEVWSDIELSKLYSICINKMKIYSSGSLCICETTIEKKDGIIRRTIEQFVIDSETLAIKSQAYQPPSKHQVIVNAEEPKRAQDILPKTTFDMGLNLSEEERKSKAATKLPYTHAQNEQGLVSLNIAAGRKIRAGGQIIYTPEEGDDLDDSDPEDDLMV